MYGIITLLYPNPKGTMMKGCYLFLLYNYYFRKHRCVTYKYRVLYLLSLYIMDWDHPPGLALTLPAPSADVSGSLDCSLKPLCSGMGEVVPARTSPTLLPPSPRTVLSLSCFKVSQCINCRDWHCKSLWSSCFLLTFNKYKTWTTRW